MSPELPLASASARLKGKPGRPRKPVPPVLTVAPVVPRLLDLHGASRYTSLSERLLRELASNGTLPRVRVPVGTRGEVRKLLFDREDVDRLIALWKEPA